MLGLNRLFRRAGPTAPTGPVPDRPFYAIGDVHGRDDLLARLLDAIAARPDGDTATLVFLGDYVDRGPDSAGVLRRIAGLKADAGARAVMLAGNHEAMMLGFLDDPAALGVRWLRNGGGQTLESFGIEVPREAEDPEAADLRASLALRLAEALEPEGRAFLDDLPLAWFSGNVAAVHAGADPRRPVLDQLGERLLWGHPDFAQRPRSDGVWIVHGHTIVATPVAAAGRISVDTGAYATDRLTAAHVTGEGVEFLTAAPT
jgi:serine/threonine protein phosphatase 1